MRNLLIILLAIICFSCQDQQKQAKINQLEQESAQLKSENQKLKAEKTTTLSNNVTPVKTVTPIPQWEEYGVVELWSYYKSSEMVWEDDQLKKVENYKLSRTGEGRVYVKHSPNGDQYELRYVSAGKDYSYHVALGNFTVETEDGVMQFNAHAGSHYFDL